VAPTWPLDQFIAVNPHWAWRSQNVASSAAALGVLAGTRLTPERDWFQQSWRSGLIEPVDLAASAATPADRAAAQSVLEGSAPLGSPESLASPCAARLPLVVDLLDAHTRPPGGMTWRERVTHQISQHAAAFFDEHQARWPMHRQRGLFGTWREQTLRDRILPWRRGRQPVAALLHDLSADPAAAIGQGLQAIGLPPSARTEYLSAALMSMHGWAAWCAYRRWQAQLQGGTDDHIVELLAIIISWERLLWAELPASEAQPQAAWLAQWSAVHGAIASLEVAQRVDWQLQTALEHSYQRRLIAGLKAPTAGAATSPPTAQAVFCIDVRSEVFRRALEAVAPRVHTRGFAGFFGLPIAYSPLGAEAARPQLPGLLAPAVCTTDAAKNDTDGQPLALTLAARRRTALQRGQRWRDFRTAPSSAFSSVEALGLFAGVDLLRDSLHRREGEPAHQAGLTPADAARLQPCWPDARRDPAAAASLALGILTAMGLVSGFAPLVLLVGHGSQTANNPHAAGLDCGACGGQTGEVNARVLADLLNLEPVRLALRPLGIDIPDGTCFVAALHNTGTDQVLLFDTEAVPSTLSSALAELQGQLSQATRLANHERAQNLGLAELHAPQLQSALQRRARDWAEVRPEWGLANCAAFVVAPRSRTRHLNLQGRVFLHDYDPALDPSLAVLTLIMTAPMVVTHWISQQYNASTLDNARYGSGNKLLHNVVGGRIGVFEGNGGDLRIGLPMQSLHDGTRWMHTPQRLSVFIEAPAEHISQVIAEHAVVQDLVGNGWLHLFQIEPNGSAVRRWTAGGWMPA
jgi:uncharacterized protein